MPNVATQKKRPQDSSLWKWIVGIVVALVAGVWIGYQYSESAISDDRAVQTGVAVEVTSRSNYTFAVLDPNAESDPAAQWTLELKGTAIGQRAKFTCTRDAPAIQSLTPGNWSVEQVTRADSSNAPVVYTPVALTRNLIQFVDGRKKYYLVAVSDPSGTQRFVTPVGLREE